MRILIADDERTARARLRRALEEMPGTVIAGEAADGLSAVEQIRALRPDLAILDVQMPELDGFAVLRAVPPDQLPVVVFVTAFDRYALQAFETQAVDYLLKPFTESRFRTAFDRARASAGGTDRAERTRLTALLEQVRVAQEELREMAGGPERHAERLLVPAEGRVVVVPIAQVDYVEAARNNVRVHSGEATHLLRESLGALEQRLDPRRFARIHRSIVVNLDRVAEIQPWFSGDGIVVLESGARLRLSRGFREAFERSLGRVARGRRG
jgi:two-component system, LytTR family, response regulator